MYGVERSDTNGPQVSFCCIRIGYSGGGVGKGDAILIPFIDIANGIPFWIYTAGSMGEEVITGSRGIGRYGDLRTGRKLVYEDGKGGNGKESDWISCFEGNIMGSGGE